MSRATRHPLAPLAPPVATDGCGLRLESAYLTAGWLRIIRGGQTGDAEPDIHWWERGGER